MVVFGTLQGEGLPPTFATLEINMNTPHGTIAHNYGSHPIAVFYLDAIGRRIGLFNP